MVVHQGQPPVDGRQRAAAIVLLVGAVVVVAGSFLPFLVQESTDGSYRVTASGWAISQDVDGRSSSSFAPYGLLLVAAALLAVAAALAMLAAARLYRPDVRTFGGLAAGFLAAAAAGTAMPAVSGLLLPDETTGFRLGAGFALLVVASLLALVAGVLTVTGLRAAAPVRYGERICPPWGPPPDPQ